METCDRCGAEGKCYGLYVNNVTATEWVAVDSGFGDYVRVCEQCEVELTFA